MIAQVYNTCTQGGQLLCQAPTGIGKTMSVLFPALKALGAGVGGPVFYLTARGTTRAAAEDALARLRAASPGLPLRSVTLTAKDKICLCETRECTPEACPYANGYYARCKDALAAALDDGTGALGAEALQRYARQYTVCPFELGLDLSLWSDVVIGDYNYLFDPVVRLQRFLRRAGTISSCWTKRTTCPTARGRCTRPRWQSRIFWLRAKRLGKGRSRLKTALGRVNEHFLAWRRRCEEAAGERFGKTVFSPRKDETFDTLLRRLCEAARSLA